MRKRLKRSLSCFLALLMLFGMCQEGMVLAVDEVDKALNPAEQIPLTVPERFQDGGNWFFIPEQGYAAGEKSEEKIYIPIQRTGDLEAEADVVLKVTDISARHDVNYQVEIYKEDVEPEIQLDDQSLVDLIANADGQEEYEPVADENEFGELVNAAGGAEIVDEDGNVLGTVTATPLDENGNPIEEEETPTVDEEVPAEPEEAPEAEPAAPGAVEETDWTDGKLSSTEALRAGRDAYTGTVSDRQELAGGDLYDFNAAGMIGMSDQEFDQEMADAVVDDYPGKEYTLHYSVGEESKFLVITPMYSEAAEGDAQIMLTLKNPSEGFAIGEDVNPVSVTIFDEDEPEAVTVSMGAETVYAENGKASITVTRQGRINAIKGVTLASWDGSATEGDEYSGIGAKLYFPVGITSRTVEIPVYHGETEKDFYVSITALDDENVETATTHVIIPAAETDGDAELMGVGSVNDHGFTDAINLKGGSFSGQGSYDSDTAFTISTSADKAGDTATYYYPASKLGYAYDGVYVEYDTLLNWCDASTYLSWGSSVTMSLLGRQVQTVAYTPVHTNSFDVGGVTRDHWLYGAWNSPAAPEYFCVTVKNDKNDGPAWSDSYGQTWVTSAHLIKRQFTIQVEDPEVKPLLGVADQDVLRDYEAVFMDGKQTRTRTLWTDDAFSVSIKNEKGPLRLAGLEAKTTDGEWVRIVTLDGKSQLANVTMNADTINALAAKKVFVWSANGNCDNGGAFYKGTLTVRPVFDYIDVTVELKPDPNGEVYMTAPVGSGDEVHEAGTYTYHLGDRISYRTEITATGEKNNLKADGISYELRKLSETGKMTDWIDAHYIGGSTTVEVTGKTIGGATVDQPHYTIKPTFTEKGNCVTVEVSKAALEYLDTTRGIFQGNVSRVESGDNWIYTIQENVLSNIPVELTVYEKTAGTTMPCWTMSSGAQSWGNTTSFRTGERTASNKVRLQVFVISEGSLMSDDGDGLLMADGGMGPTYASITGTVATSTFNLSTERSATDLLPAQSAYVSYGDTGTWTDEDGKFELPAVFAMGGAPITYTVTYNGATSIQTVKVPGPSTPKSDKLTMDMRTVQAVTAGAGVVKVESFSETGAHFVSAYAEQDNILKGTVNGLIMNGLSMTIAVQVAQGEDYILNGEVYSEHVKDVTLYFQDQVTGEIHGLFSSNETPSENSPAKWSYDEETGVFTLRINQFDPGHPTEWTYGDVLMARLTTDKKAGLTAFDESVDMVYEPVSTGIAVYADPDYEPRTFDYDLDNIAEMLGVTPQTNEDGELLDDDDTRYSFGAFPYIGEITACIHVFSRVASSSTVSAEMNALMADVADMAGEDDEYSEMSTSGGETKNYTLNVLIKMDETVWGGVRFMFGIVVSGGGGNGYQRQRNPFQTVRSMVASQMNVNQRNAVIESNNANDYVTRHITRSGVFGSLKELQSNFGGPRFTFSVFVGFYLDYGYVEISTDNGAEKSHDMVFMGAGGFIGFGGTLGYTWAFVAGTIPMYTNVEAGLNVTFFIGSEGNPQKTLQSFKTDKELHGQDFQFNVEIKGRVYVAGTIGAGFYKIMGVRVTVEVAFEAGYSNNVRDWYPNLFDKPWGYVSEATFTGSMDLIVTSIDFYSASWPLPLADGFLYYFQETKRANRCISYVETAIQDGEGSDAARATAQEMVNELKKLVDVNELLGDAGADTKPQLADVETIKSKTTALKDYAYDNDIINWTTKNTIEMNKQAGIIGNIINAVTEEEDGQGIRYHTNDHVDQSWVANDGALMSAFGNASSQAIVQDAYAQPSSRILSIGGGKYLLVFLGDTAGRDRMAAATLTYAIYDENTEEWTAPQTLAGDHVADSKPHLTDAGDKVILSWAGIPTQKYNDLKNTFKTELTEATGAEPADDMICEAMEADPARVMAGYEIYSVEFNKSAATFGTPVQLTSDDYYDDYPQTVYDAGTGDYIVMYYKTAQDGEDYESAGDKLQDLIGASPDPEKTYSAICYMIHNGTADENAGQKDDSGEACTVPEGWVLNYLYTGELNAESLAAYGGTEKYLNTWRGQRFLPSTIRNEDGSYSDPPITDLTVAPGRNGIVTFAFTVDKDFDLKTAEDRELYVQFYNLETHAPYVPVKVGGEITVSTEKYDAESDSFVPVTSTKQVEVGAPKLIRNSGDTFLFWREDGQSLKYLNVTEMLNARVAAVPEPGDSESDWTYAVNDDGTFATDAATGIVYTPRTQKVNLASLMTDDSIEITDYEVITDAEDNLYVVWTDTVTSNVTNEVGETYSVASQEIFASAMIAQEDDTVRWSEPYRLTRDNAFNDGLALALDSDGGLIIVHNQYTKLMAQSEAEAYRLLEEGKLGVTQDKDGTLYIPSLAYNSPVNLMVTRLQKIGSLEATAFTFSDDHPVSGETIRVDAAIENVGLTDAYGSQIDFYAYRDGVRGELIKSFTSQDTIQVNTAKHVAFPWTIPEGDVEGLCIQAVIQEGNGDGYYEPVESYSEPFTVEPRFDLSVTEVTQEGDQFRVVFEAANDGNQDAAEGTTAYIRLVGLYGDLNSDRYGNLETDELYRQDISSELKAKTLAEKNETDQYALAEVSSFENDVLVDIPFSVFRYCGYDAIQVVITDKSGNVLAESDQTFVTLDTPVNLDFNGGRSVNIQAGETQQVSLHYDSTVFMDEGTLVYAVEDPSIAYVDEDGNITGLAGGATTLTATLLPSGRTASVDVFVEEACPLDAFTDLNKEAWYHNGVHWALENGVMYGVSSDRFDPDGTTTRAMIVAMLYRMEGRPATGYTVNFKDVPDGKWYTDAVRWAAENGIVYGYSEDTFGPNDTVTREQIVAILKRYAQFKGIDTTEGESKPLQDFEDVRRISGWATGAFRWAVDAGLIYGTGNNKLSPKADATRAQVATMLMRLDTLLADK